MAKVIIGGQMLSLVPTLLVSFAVFTLLYIGLVTMRYALGLAEDARDEAPDGA